MLSWLASLTDSCSRPVLSRFPSMGRTDEEDDALLWSRDLERHSLGEFSFAIVQANASIEDHGQVETCPDATFVGVYDGHGGPDASQFTSDHLFKHLVRLARENETISEDVIRNAFVATEDAFIDHVRKTRECKPLIAAIGSCCLVGFIWGQTLFIANAGDSRAIIGCVSTSNDIIAEQLSRDDNASLEEVRQELKSLHPDDSQIVVLKQGVWRVKGIIQVSRSIGDAYLKMSEFALDPSFKRFWLSEPLRRPVLTAEPIIRKRVICAQNKFLIFASDGLWEHLTNQEAAEIVHNYPREGIAKRLVVMAQQVAAKKREVRYADLTQVDRGTRRFFHDDITVIVLFIDYELLGKNTSLPHLSVRGFVDAEEPSEFSSLEFINLHSKSSV
ncbi:hypothetical protein ACLOJK_017315 [Asimina triloba]